MGLLEMSDLQNVINFGHTRFIIIYFQTDGVDYIIWNHYDVP